MSKDKYTRYSVAFKGGAVRLYFEGGYRRLCEQLGIKDTSPK